MRIEESRRRKEKKSNPHTTQQKEFGDIDRAIKKIPTIFEKERRKEKKHRSKMVDIWTEDDYED
jgi:hypothetical protein